MFTNHRRAGRSQRRFVGSGLLVLLIVGLAACSGSPVPPPPVAPVSEPVAAAMAEAVRAKTGADVGVGITGIAGPGGGTAERPVGTVAIAVVVPGQPAYIRTYQFMGGRAMVKFQATQAAMDRIRRMLGG